MVQGKWELRRILLEWSFLCLIRVTRLLYLIQVLITPLLYRGSKSLVCLCWSVLTVSVEEHPYRQTDRALTCRRRICFSFSEFGVARAICHFSFHFLNHLSSPLCICLFVERQSDRDPFRSYSFWDPLSIVANQQNDEACREYRSSVVGSLVVA